MCEKLNIVYAILFMQKNINIISVMRLDLSGPEGNAFYLMMLVKKLGTQLGLTQEKIDDITKQMKSSGYDNLVKVFGENFEGAVELYKDGELYDWH